MYNLTELWGKQLSPPPTWEIEYGVIWKERRLALPLTRMEEALGPDNIHTIKALPPTSWHLTIVFIGPN